MILNGAKIMSMELEASEIKFCDSLNFLPMPLKALPKTFGLTELKKGYFPHFFNRKDTQHYVGPLPRVEDYGPDSMNTKESKSSLPGTKSSSQPIMFLILRRRSKSIVAVMLTF